MLQIERGVAMRYLLLWLGAALALSCEMSSSQAASDYFFCLAADYRSHVVYLTSVFQSGTDRDRLQKALAIILSRQGRSFDVVQCPMPLDFAGAAEAQSAAEQFNRKSGFRIVQVPISG